MAQHIAPPDEAGINHVARIAGRWWGRRSRAARLAILFAAFLLAVAAGDGLYAAGHVNPNQRACADISAMLAAPGDLALIRADLEDINQLAPSLDGILAAKLSAANALGFGYAGMAAFTGAVIRCSSLGYDMPGS